MGFFQDIRAGALAAVGAVTGDAAHARPGPELTAASTLVTPTVPPMELGSPWVTSELNAVLVDIFGADQLPLTREAAMSIPAVAKARHTICPTLARLPFLVDGDETPELRAFLDQPDKSTTRFLTLTWTLDDQLFYGVSWWQVLDRYSSGRVKSVRRILPGGVGRVDGGRWTVYDQPVDPSTLRRLDGPHEGLLNFAAVTLRQAASMEATVTKHSANPIPALELHQTNGVTLSPAERQELVTSWAKARAGENGGVAYTSPNVEVKTHGAVPEQLLITGRNAAAVDIARHAGIPADSIDATPEKQSMTYSNVQMRLQALIDLGLASYAEALTSRLSLDDFTPHGVRVGLDYDKLTAATDSDPTTPAPPSAPAAGSAPAQEGPA